MRKNQKQKESFFSNLVKYTSFMDFLGEKPEFYISGSKRSKTFLGGILSFNIITFAFIAFFYFGQEIYFRNFPKNSLSSIIDDGEIPIILDKHNFLFFLSAVDSSQNLIDLNSDYIDMKSEVNSLCNNKSNIGDENFFIYNSLNKEPVKLRKCSEKNSFFFPQDSTYNSTELFYKKNRYDEILSKVNLSNYFCLEKPVEIFGSKENLKMKFLEIELKPCLDFFAFIAEETGMDKGSLINRYSGVKDFSYFDSFPTDLKFLELLKEGDLTEIYSIEISNKILNTKICPLKKIKKLEDIKNQTSDYNRNINIIKKGEFILKYIKTNFDGRLWNDFGVFTLDEERINFSFEDPKEIDLFVKKIKYKTDTGYMLESYEDSDFLNIEKISINKNSKSAKERNSSLQSLLIFRINANEICDVVYRKYLKVQKLIAEVGGCFESLIIFGLFLNYFNNNAKFYEKLIDEIFDVDDVYKYSQFFDSTKKIRIKRYRDSIMLRNTKDMEKYRKSINKRSEMRIKGNFNPGIFDSSDNMVIFIYNFFEIFFLFNLR